MIHHRIASRVFNTPLLIHPGKAAAIAVGLGGRLVDGHIEFTGAAPLDHRPFSMGTVSDRMGRHFDNRGIKPYDVIDGVAVIPVEGTLVHKGAWIESDSGETSYQGLQTQVVRAARDPSIKAVAFEIDSCGGELSGAFETSDMVHALSGIKPTIAILSDAAYSAGYLMAAAARQIVIPEQGGAGSIGVITMHTDMSRALDSAGIKVTVLRAGEHKAEGTPFEPLGDDVAERIRAELETARQTFASRVAKYRGARLTFDAAMATEAQVYTGADAVALGLADATGHPSNAFMAFVKAVNRA